MTSSKSFINDGLAGVYGVASVTGPTLVERALDPTQRQGLFTEASFLAAHATLTSSHPVKRGKKLLIDVLCGTVPPPPPGIPDPAAPSPSISTRERFAMHGLNVCAKACHGLMDPLGFAFEHYDAIGAYRAMDGGKPVDASGAFVAPSGAPPAAFQDAIGLMKLVAASEDARRCVTNRWFR